MSHEITTHHFFVVITMCNIFFINLWSYSSGDLPYDYSSKIGDIQNMKVEKS
jgi:hypothetical protein